MVWNTAKGVWNTAKVIQNIAKVVRNHPPNDPEPHQIGSEYRQSVQIIAKVVWKTGKVVLNIPTMVRNTTIIVGYTVRIS